MTHVEAEARANANRDAARARGLVALSPKGSGYTRPAWRDAADKTLLVERLQTECEMMPSSRATASYLEMGALTQAEAAPIVWRLVSVDWIHDWALALLMPTVVTFPGKVGATDVYLVPESIRLRWISDIAHGTAVARETALEEACACTHDPDLLARISAASAWPRTNARVACPACGWAMAFDREAAAWVCIDCKRVTAAAP